MIAIDLTASSPRIFLNLRKCLELSLIGQKDIFLAFRKTLSILRTSFKDQHKLEIYVPVYVYLSELKKIIREQSSFVVRKIQKLEDLLLDETDEISFFNLAQEYDFVLKSISIRETFYQKMFPSFGFLVWGEYFFLSKPNGMEFYVGYPDVQLISRLFKDVFRKENEPATIICDGPISLINLTNQVNPFCVKLVSLSSCLTS
ncbi:MAG: hypothetical protein NZT61_00535 [Deltaproteobacteria bacterium]|nr:hypothetical protein [Deltaproteobacteria bacterium]MCX7952030.1 hypothetical protein [Deltaproteobacteria bacterium]